MNMKKIIAAASATALSAGLLAAYASAAITSDAVIDFTPTAADYEYAGYAGSLSGNSGDVIAIDITANEGTDLSGLRLEFVDKMGSPFWASENEQGTLYTIDGKTLVETDFTAGTATTVYIDVTKSGIPAGDFHIHTNGTGTGSFKLENITLMAASEVPSTGDDNSNSGADSTSSDDNGTSGTDSSSSDSSTGGDEGNVNTGVGGVAALAGAALLAAGVLVAAKKRK